MADVYRVGEQRYRLVRRAYDDAIFGHEAYELLDESGDTTEGDGTERALVDRLAEISFCTFRGAYQQRLIHLLEGNQFRFIDDFLTTKVYRKRFKKLMKRVGLHIDVVQGIPDQATIDTIVKLQKSVYDFSTFQQDERLDPEALSTRNVLKIESLFEKENFLAFLVKSSQQDRHVAFLQFLVHQDHATAENGAVDPGFQNLFVGAGLYSYSFDYIFTELSQVKNIFLYFSLSNQRVMNMVLEMGGSIEKREVHLRKISSR